jgi:hypothetical protein
MVAHTVTKRVGDVETSVRIEMPENWDRHQRAEEIAMALDEAGIGEAREDEPAAPHTECACCDAASTVDAVRTSSRSIRIAAPCESSAIGSSHSDIVTAKAIAQRALAAPK